MAAELNNQYMLAPSLQMYFVDKDTGLPLVNGQVFFYEDQARTVPKPVYQIVSGMPSAPYTYDPLPNPISLSAVGTFEDDNGNDILPYYYPFDSMGNIELYYIEVYDSDGVLQFTREAWPNFSSEDLGTDQDVTNFVPNGQFLAHNNIGPSAANNFVANQVSAAVTIIAQGGWTFERSTGSTATDLITFPRFAAYTDSPSGNPRYSCQIQSTVSGNDTRKDLCIRWPDVNKFASSDQTYNLYFEGSSATGSDITNVQVIVRKFFGTGGTTTPSTTSEVVIGTLTLFASQNSAYNFNILFGTNEALVIGTNNDDYVQICMRLPPTGTQTAVFDDFALTLDDVTLTSFPTETNAEQLDASLAGWLPTPNPDGSDLYLPVRLTPTGMDYDHSIVGNVVASLSLTPGHGELLADGSTYFTRGYSTDGVPYSRLQKVLFSAAFGVPLYGTGATFATSVLLQGSPFAGQFLELSMNQSGSVTAPNPQASGFTITQTTTALTAGQNYGVTAYKYTGGGVLFKSLAVGGVTPPSATGSIIVSDVVNAINRNDPNSPQATFHYFAAQFPPASSLATGSVANYLLFTLADGNGVYIWFQVTNETDPGAGGIPCKVKLNGGESAFDVCNIVASVMNSAGAMYSIAAPAGSAIPQSSYWTFSTPNDSSYYVWYNVGAAGVDPKPVNVTFGIQVNIGSTDSAASVATATSNAINNTYFAVPNFQGLFLRGYDPTSLWDLDTTTRAGLAVPISGNTLGTIELDSFYSHTHAINIGGVGGGLAPNVFGIFADGGDSNLVGAGANGAPAGTYTFTNGFTGGAESRPVNANVNWMIKY